MGDARHRGRDRHGQFVRGDQEQLRESDPDYAPVIVVACSSAQYGASMTPENVPISKRTPILPLHPYGVSKVAQDLLAFPILAQRPPARHPGPDLQHARAAQAARRGLDFAQRIARIRRESGRCGSRATWPRNLDPRRPRYHRGPVDARRGGRAARPTMYAATPPIGSRSSIGLFEELTDSDPGTRSDPALFGPNRRGNHFSDNRKLKSPAAAGPRPSRFPRHPGRECSTMRNGGCATATEA